MARSIRSPTRGEVVGLLSVSLVFVWFSVCVTPSARRVLTVMPARTWRVVVGDRWAVETLQEEAVPLERSRLWLLPLLDRPRDEVEAAARPHLTATAPALSEPINAMIVTALRCGEYYVSRLTGWLRTEEILTF